MNEIWPDSIERVDELTKLRRARLPAATDRVPAILVAREFLGSEDVEVRWLGEEGCVALGDVRRRAHARGSGGAASAAVAKAYHPS